MATPLVLERYKFGELISNGFNGKVHKVFSRETEALYACRSVDYRDLSQRTIKQLKKDKLVLTKLDHPSVVPIVDIVDDESAMTIHYIMEYFECGDLGRYIRKHAQEETHVSEERVWIILTQLVEGLAYLHNPHKRNAQGMGVIVHKHLLPANILVTDEDDVKISDYRVPRSETESVADEAFMKRQSYRSPESLVSEAENDSVDIWSLGCVLYELCTFQAPFIANDMSSLLQQIDSAVDANKIPAVYSDDLRNILKSMLVVNRRKRNSVVGLRANKTIKEYLRQVQEHNHEKAARKLEQERALRNSGQPFVDLKRSLLMIAAEEGNVKAIKKNLKRDIGKQDLLGKTALMYAAENGHEAICRLLDSELGLRCNKGMTALMYATESGRLGCIEYLARHEAGAQSADQRTALMMAVLKKNLRAVEILAQVESGIVNRDQVSATMLACCEGNTFAVNAISQHEAGLQDIKGWSALHYAAARNSVLCMNYLIKAEAKKVTNIGLTPLMIAAYAGHVKAVKKLLPYNKRCWDQESRTALMYAVRANKLETARLLVGEEGNFQDKQRRTALMLAVERNYVPIVELLVNSPSIEPGLRNIHGHTALHIATIHRYVECAALLLPKEAGLRVIDPNTQEEGETALELAFRKGDYIMASLLAPAEGPVPTGIIDERRKTDLIRAVEQGNTLAALCFVDQAGCVDMENKTALMHAAALNYPDIVRLLISYEGGMEVNGMLALTYALMAGNDEIVELLAPCESLDTSQYSREDNRRTELMTAVSEGDVFRTWCFRFQAGLRDVDGTTALMIAAITGNFHAARLLAPHEAGMRRNDRQRAYTLAIAAKNNGVARFLAQYEDTNLNVQGNTPLMLAAVENRIADFAGLKKHLKQANADGKTALMFAAERGYLDAVKLLLDESGARMTTSDWRDGYSALMLAAKFNHASVCEVLLTREKGMRNRNEWTALMVAAQADSVDAAAVLLKDEAGMLLLTGEMTTFKTAMMVAAEYGRLGVVQLLLPFEAGKQTSDGHSALMFAATNGHEQVTELLARSEAKLQLSLKSAAPGSTAMHLAAELGHASCLRPLLSFASGVAVKRNDGITALMLAASRNHVECVRLLKARQMRLQSNAGMTALMLAASRGHADCVRELIDEEFGLTNNDGFTALALAAKAGHSEAVRLLLPREGDIPPPDGTRLADVAAEDVRGLIRDYLQEQNSQFQRSNTLL
ncbi:Kinase, NEK [Giardia muris]|uniref:Kinase, NEK n=1 Tax=Giardia muris TaxID=5742 RepID=A0A4Z1SKS6_GIAMU|nr:Kinase, NEK [Giardia muris]|eukprot:TNJ26256.1 Kinase, NEK [Giardia muris]